jgi:negative regulator of replication initiation
MIRTQIQIDSQTYEKIKAKSKGSGKSISEIVRRSLDQTIESQESDLKWARALNSLGKFASGLDNLAEKHDEHLGDRW